MIEAFMQKAGDNLAAARHCFERFYQNDQFQTGRTDCPSHEPDSETISGCRTEFHSALGQFINYRNILEETEPDRILYLAVPSYIYESFFKSRFGQLAIRKNNLRMITYNPEKEEIEEWIN